MYVHVAVRVRLDTQLDPKGLVLLPLLTPITGITSAHEISASDEWIVILQEQY